MLDMGYMQHLIENSYDYHNTGLQVPSVGEMEVVAMNEATYYGKNKKLLEVEKILDDMCVEARSHGTGTTKFNASMVEVGDKLADIFGFKEVMINSSLTFLLAKFAKDGDLDLLTVDAAAVSRSAIFKYISIANGKGKVEVIDIDKTHSGVKFNPKDDYVMRMFIATGAFLDYGNYSLTGGEILSLILHEIGHQFYRGPVRELGPTILAFLTFHDIIAIIRKTFTSFIMTTGTEWLDKIFMDNVPEYKERASGVYNKISPIVDVIEKITSMLGIPLYILSIPVKLARMILSLPVKIPRAFIKYDSEKYSDAFTTSFGYGAELASAIDKTNHTRMPFFSKSDTLVNIDDLFRFIVHIPMDLMSALTDQHPNDIARLNNDIKYMEAAGKRKMTPAVKADYDKALADMYRLRDEVIEYKGFNTYKNIDKINALLQQLTHVTDIKDLTSSLNAFTVKYKNLDFD